MDANEKKMARYSFGTIPGPETRSWASFCKTIDQFFLVFTQSMPLPRWKASEERGRKREKFDHRCPNRRSIHSVIGEWSSVGPGRGLSNTIFVNCEIQSCGLVGFYLCGVGSRFDLEGSATTQDFDCSYTAVEILDIVASNRQRNVHFFGVK